jgi:hypothetical protein
LFAHVHLQGKYKFIPSSLQTEHPSGSPL